MNVPKRQARIPLIARSRLSWARESLGGTVFALLHLFRLALLHFLDEDTGDPCGFQALYHLFPLARLPSLQCGGGVHAEAENAGFVAGDA